MEIDRSYTSPNNSPRGKHSITMLVIHATAGSARSSLAWLTNPAAKVSAHFVIDKAGKVYQLVPDDLAAWHAGRASWRGTTAVNECSLGIELENSDSGRDPYPPAQLDALQALCREKIAQYGIPMENVVRHLDVAVPRGRKSDPAGFDWAGFRAKLVGVPEPSAPYRAISAGTWVRDSPTNGKHVRDLAKGEAVRVVAIVTGDLLVRPIGISNKWAKLAGDDHQYVWLLQLQEVPV